MWLANNEPSVYINVDRIYEYGWELHENLCKCSNRDQKRISQRRVFGKGYVDVYERTDAAGWQWLANGRHRNVRMLNDSRANIDFWWNDDSSNTMRYLVRMFLCVGGVRGVREMSGVRIISIRVNWNFRARTLRVTMLPRTVCVCENVCKYILCILITVISRDYLTVVGAWRANGR